MLGALFKIAFGAGYLIGMTLDDSKRQNQTNNNRLNESNLRKSDSPYNSANRRRVFRFDKRTGESREI